MEPSLPRLIVAGWRELPARWFLLLSLGALGYLGVSAIRFVTTAALVLPVLVVFAGATMRLGALPAGGVPGEAPAGRGRLASLAVAGTAMCALILCVKVAAWGYTTQGGARRLGIGLDARAVPEQAADFVRSLPLAGRIFNEHAIGAYLAWRWNGEPRIFYHGYVIDPRFYERDYLGVNLSPEEFDRIVRTYDIGAFLLEMQPVTPTRGPLFHRLLLTRPEWKLVYWDLRAMVFLRDRPEHRALVEVHEYRYLDPFRIELVDVGLRRDPRRLLDEAVRALRHAPGNEMARRLIEQAVRRAPDAFPRMK